MSSNKMTLMLILTSLLMLILTLIHFHSRTHPASTYKIATQQRYKTCAYFRLSYSQFNVDGNNHNSERV